jgi:fructose-1,6-bisphosphatase/inositol monophosphatase family enzyme
MQMAGTFHQDVAALMREAAQQFILPRFRALGAGDVLEKAPGDLVTVADRDSEAFLSARLAALLPGARVLGEEAEAATPGHVADPGRGTVWTVDPLDGTHNFAAGRAPFAVMVGLVVDGEAEAGWILDPLTDRLCSAVRGCGAWIDGRRTAVPAPADERPRVASGRRRRGAGWDAVEPVPIPRCAGEQYARLLLGEADIALFDRSRPWDHVPGALLLEEAGGAVSRPDGSAYRLDRPGEGLVAAGSARFHELGRRLWAG